MSYTIFLEVMLSSEKNATWKLENIVPWLCFLLASTPEQDSFPGLEVL